MAAESKNLTNRERFIANMEYRTADRVPNYELGVWAQTVQRWVGEGALQFGLHWDWFTGEEYFGMDGREFIGVDYSMKPPFEEKVLETTDRYELIQRSNGIISKALLEGRVGGARMCMDEFVKFPVETARDFEDLKKRYRADLAVRYPAQWKTTRVAGWKNRDHVLVLGRNCAACGFYWRAREWMGTENLSYAWYDQPALAHEMMEFFADFTIAVSRPILEAVDVEYFNLNEDFAMKNGPLLSPATFKEFIFSPMRRLIDFFKSHGTRYIVLDSDGNCEALIPLLMEAGVDVIWPLERAAGMDPVKLRQKFGKSLRLWGGVDKRILARGPREIDEHLRELAPLVAQGGFIPTVDHTVPPDVSWGNFCHYMKRKQEILGGK